MFKFNKHLGIFFNNKEFISNFINYGNNFWIPYRLFTFNNIPQLSTASRVYLRWRIMYAVWSGQEAIYDK